jgi:hypothetical protein
VVGVSEAVDTSGAGPDLIAGYLAELSAGLRVPAAEAELILAEAEDHLRETAAAGMAITGLSGPAAQEAAISSFGPVRAVIRAHRRRTVTGRDAVLAAWKLTALLATTLGAGGVTGLRIFHYLVRTSPSALLGPTGGVPGVPVVCLSQCPGRGHHMDPLQLQLIVYAAIAAGGLVLFGARWLAVRRLARRGAVIQDPLTPAFMASSFLLASALLFVLVKTGVAVLVSPVSMTWNDPLGYGSASTTPLVPDAVITACLVAAAGFGAWAAIRWARTVLRSAAARALPRLAAG